MSSRIPPTPGLQELSPSLPTPNAKMSREDSECPGAVTASASWDSSVTGGSMMLLMGVEEEQLYEGYV
jgi:hypothetical protein